MAARLNFKLQACLIRRRFARRSQYDLSSLGQLVNMPGSEDLMDHSPEERAQILARSLARIRPELDLYLMTEISVEDLAGRLSHHFRRIFYTREGSLELHLSILDGIAARYHTPFFDALRTYSHRPTGVFHALPVSHGKSIVIRTVPGQVFSRQILSFMRSLDTPEVHGYRPELGYRVYVDKALEIAAATGPAAPPDGAMP
jgi:arginine decarboxylase